MNTQAQAEKVLEWHRFIELAQNEASTEPGKRLLGDLADPSSWAPDIQAARIMQQETQEITPLLDRDALWGPLTNLRDPQDTLERLSRGAVLEVSEFVNLRSWLYAIDSWSQTPREEIRGERLKKALAPLLDPFKILRTLEQILTPDGELSEKASPQLALLYSEIRSLKRQIGNVLDDLLKNYSQQGLLQENFSDVRDGRYVIPVRISAQNEIDGIIYEASASGQTVFVEPREVGALNNRLRLRQNDLMQEIFAILQKTSQQLQPYVSEIQLAVNTLAHWDAVHAKARLGRHYSGKTLQITEDRTFLLKQTAHPLLWWSLPPDSIVRNQIEFVAPASTFLLTGPNTGGKTVLLKTLGLAGICAKTGFPFPSTDQPVVPFFDSFFADLGDPQSIEEHLSSFSGHVLRFKEILEKITDKSLVLIDELNSATDPEEGGAFGRAVLETLISRNAMIVTTTHDPHLKALAVSDPRIVNASMAFDESSRTPTYRMILGVPGRSRALETAERLGIPKPVIDLARSYLSREHNEFERTLKQLESDAQELARARKEAVALRDEAERLKTEWFNRTESSISEMMEKTRHRLRRILEQAQDEVRSTVRKLDELKSRREIDQARSQINQFTSSALSEIESALREEAPDIAKTLALKNQPQEPSGGDQIQVGSKVRIPKWKSSGSVLEISGGRIKVAMGTMQMTLAREDVEVMTETQSKSQKAATKVRVHLAEAGSEADESLPNSIDLRGVRFDEAMSRLERFLNQVYQSGRYQEISIVHGLGTGALREGTHKLLRELPYIKNYRDGGPGQGGSGATIVEFEI